MINAILATFMLIGDKPFMAFDEVSPMKCNEYQEALSLNAEKSKLPLKYMCFQGEFTVQRPDADWISATVMNISEGVIPIMVIGISTVKGETFFTNHYSLKVCQDKKLGICAYTTQKVQNGFTI
jgi:hypothetical protein